MKIFYRQHGKRPSEGDRKTLASGRVFYRRQSRVFGGYQVSNGRPVYNWIDEDNESVADYKVAFEKHGAALFRSTTDTKVPKTRNIRVNLQTEAGRARYQQITGQSVSADTTVASAVLTVQASA